MDLSSFWQGAAIVLIGMFTAWTAWSQYSINKEKFKLDLFEKRFSIFKATRKFLSIVLRDAEISLEDIYEYRANTSEVDFFFKKDVIDYLKEIDNRALKLRTLNEKIKDLSKGNERSKKAEDIDECLNFLISKLPELKTVFNPYMKFKI
jgi:hypothetical protein